MRDTGVAFLKLFNLNKSWYLNETDVLNMSSLAIVFTEFSHRS